MSNTLVVYAADQGWMGGQNGMWGMGDHSRPIGAHELMMQIPLIFRQPGAIPAGKTSDLLVSNYDFLPTRAELSGAGRRDADEAEAAGARFFGRAAGQEQAWDNVVFYEMETCRAIRTDRWKYVARHPSGPHELYDMQADPRERFNLYGQPGTEAMRADLDQRLTAFFQAVCRSAVRHLARRPLEGAAAGGGCGQSRSAADTNRWSSATRIRAIRRCRLLWLASSSKDVPSGYLMSHEETPTQQIREGQRPVMSAMPAARQSSSPLICQRERDQEYVEDCPVCFAVRT